MTDARTFAEWCDLLEGYGYRFHARIQRDGVGNLAISFMSVARSDEEERDYIAFCREVMQDDARYKNFVQYCFATHRRYESADLQ